MSTKYRKPSLEQRLIEGLENFANALESKINVAERFTSREMTLNLVAKSYDARSVKDVRAMLGASQAIFAQFLGVSPSIVQKWERGERIPSKLACRFMDELRHDPQRSKKRFYELLRSRSSSAPRPRSLKAPRRSAS